MIFPFYIWTLYEPIFPLKILFLTRLYLVSPSQIKTKNWDTVLGTDIDCYKVPYFNQAFSTEIDKAWNCYANKKFNPLYDTSNADRISLSKF